MPSKLPYAVFILALAFFSCHSRKQVDLIIRHGKIYTVDSAFDKSEAFAIKDGRILAVGTDREIMGQFESGQVVDAGGKAVYPGLIDAHAHFVAYGQTLFAVNLYGCKSIEEVAGRVKQFVATHPSEDWIVGQGWDQNKFPGKAFPDNTLLNQMFPATPVILKRIDGHAFIANAKALETGGVYPGQKLTGGEVETKAGKLTGILIDNAGRLVRSKIPIPSAADYVKWLRGAQEHCFAQGLTTITECGLDFRVIELIDSLQKAGILKMRLYVMLSDKKDNLDRYLAREPYKTDRLYVKGVKAYADGALGSRGACLLEPYMDKKGWYGFLLSHPEHFDSLARRVAGTDFQLCTHAIGDSANRLILGIYNKYLGGKNDRRWRIEHAQIINEADFSLFGKGSVIPSVQPTHATSDMYWAAERLGDYRLKGGYAYKQLLRQNGWIPLGTDCPVEDISPFKTFLAAVFRTDANGFPAGGFQMENALSREEAIRGMTIWAARADCLEKEVGSIEPGKKADFVILDRDLMEVSQSDVLKIKVLSTYSGGVKVF